MALHTNDVIDAQMTSIWNLFDAKHYHKLVLNNVRYQR